jgi:hypothetical protein
MMVKLGTVVTDSLTGFTGTATSRTEYLFGCVRVYVEPTGLHDGSPIEGQYFDEQRLTTKSAAKVGGPAPAPRRNPDAPR